MESVLVLAMHTIFSDISVCSSNERQFKRNSNSTHPPIRSIILSQRLPVMFLLFLLNLATLTQLVYMFTIVLGPKFELKVPI